MNKKAAIFDMDGVIIDSEPLYVEMNRELFGELGIYIPESEYHTFVGMSSPLMWGYIREKFSLTQSAEELMNIEKERIHELLNSSRISSPVSGVANLLDELKLNNIALGIASSAARKNVKTVLNKLGLSEYFISLTCGEDVEHGKPAPDIFLKAAERMAAEPANCVVIEDSLNGLTGAKAAGMRCIGYAGDPNSKQDLSGADLIIKSFGNVEIAAVLNFVNASADVVH